LQDAATTAGNYDRETTGLFSDITKGNNRTKSQWQHFNRDRIALWEEASRNPDEEIPQLGNAYDIVEEKREGKPAPHLTFAYRERKSPHGGSPLPEPDRLSINRDRDKLIDGSGEPFFVLNSDVISEYPLKEMIEFHKSHGREASIMVTKVDEPSKGPHIVGNVLVDETAVIGEGCLIGPDVAIGPGCVVESGVRLSRCTVMRGARIKNHACISSSIIGWHSTVGQWARVENMTILGEDVHVCDEIYSNGGVVLPHKEIKSSILKPEIVM
ncbi:hypothetical protein IFM89_035167, partial [Coptis chinensis]